MSCIVYQTDHKTGIKYAYESVSYWDKDKKQPRSKRKYIGRVDPETGEIIQKKERGHSADQDESLSSEIAELREAIKEKDAIISEMKNSIKEKDLAYKKLLKAVKDARKLLETELDEASDPRE